MLKLLKIIKYLFICTIFSSALSKSTKNDTHTKQSQYHGNSTKEKDLSEMERLHVEVPTFSNNASLKMLEDITAKVWRILPVIDIPKSWVLAYCMKNTEIAEEVEKATMQCQRDGVDWDCAFIELGGGRDDFNMRKVVSLFNDISNREMRSKLLHAAEVCSKLWRRYKQVQDKRLTRMRLNVQAKSRRKRSSKKHKKSKKNKKRMKKNKKHSKKKKNDLKEELRNARRVIKEMKAIRRRLANRITEFENKKSLSPEEAAELDRLYLTAAGKPRVVFQYPLTEERAELSRLQEIGSCLSRQTVKACEFFVLNVIQKLI